MAAPFPADERLEVAADLVVRARIFYDIWRYYEDAETRPAIIGALNQYSEVFRFDTHANFFTFIVYVAGLLEARNDTVNLPALIDEYDRAKLITPQVIADSRAILAQIQPLRSKLIILRSNLFAHRSASDVCGSSWNGRARSGAAIARSHPISRLGQQRVQGKRKPAEAGFGADLRARAIARGRLRFTA